MATGHRRGGPPPDPYALRRDRNLSGDEWVELPAEGRPGRVPAWPLKERASARERDLWKWLWKLPQAMEWERLQLHHLLGLYVRVQVEAEEPGAPASQRTVAGRMADNLGVSAAGMARNRWRVGPMPQGRRPARGSKTSGSSRNRFRVVDGDGNDAS